MKKNTRLWILSVLCLAVLVGRGRAEDLPRDEGPLGIIKDHLTSSAQENARLAEENKVLKAQLVSLQLEIERYGQDISALDLEHIKVREASREFEILPVEGVSLNDEALIQEAQNIYLSGQGMEGSEAQKLRELQLYDLQYEKQELQLDLKSIKFLSQKLRDQQDPELNSLQGVVKSNEDRLNDLASRIDWQERVTLAYPRQIELLEAENKALKKKIKRLKKMR